MDWLKEIKMGEWVVVFATLIGPILAVQAQKLVESFREKRSSKYMVFRSLMATRGTRLSQEHVGALNMIDLTFYGNRVFGFRWQTKAEAKVTEAWKVYLDHLYTETKNFSEAQHAVLTSERNSLFVNLLKVMGADIGFHFDDVVVSKGGYSPNAHGWMEEKQAKLLDSALEFFQCQKPIQMDVRSFPVDPAIAAIHRQMLEQIVDATKDGKLEVSVLSGQA